MLYDIAQVGIFIFGGGSVLLLSLNNRWSKYGPVAGFVGLPAFLYAGLHDGAWGLIVLQVVMASFHIVGIYSFWFRKGKIRNRVNKKVISE